LSPFDFIGVGDSAIVAPAVANDPVGRRALAQLKPAIPVTALIPHHLDGFAGERRNDIAGTLRPLEDDYKDYLKNPYADISNVGGRYGGAVTAAMFLKEFADPTPWVHLDIAGTAWLDEGKPFLAKGPTGVPLRSMVRLAMDWQP
jgi:hypothetical protein